MVAGRRFWNLIWYGILLLGVAGLLPSLYWGRRTHWKNADELLRAIGTITVSVGMLMLLNHWGGTVGQVLMVVALVCFVLAFVLGRKQQLGTTAQDDESSEDE
jgi:predicted MFS family arabinose efflux permease